MTRRDSVNQTNRSAAEEDRTQRCPICGAPVPPDAEAPPFCSTRCRLVDLGRWMSGDYTISREIKDSDIEEGD